MNMPSFRQPRLLAYAAAMFWAPCSSARTHYHSLTPIHQAIWSELPRHHRLHVRCNGSGRTAAGAYRYSPSRALAVPVEADRMQLLLHRHPLAYPSTRPALGSPLADQISLILIDNLRNALPNLSITSDPLLLGTGNASTNSTWSRGVGRACRKGSHRPRAVEIVGQR